MNQEEREALTEKATQRLVAGLHQTNNAEQMMIRATLTSYGVALFAAGRRSSEEWIGRILASLPIPMVITRIIPEGEGAQEPVLTYHWHTQDGAGDGVTFTYCLEQALLTVLHRREQQPGARSENRVAPGEEEEEGRSGKQASQRPVPESKG